ncbi:hypothetical protein CMK12_06040 [Candidatus Poribacteria bacterium]|nr:hypothetical protein [Candidatus Poribacteria bacterium]
MTAPQQPHIGEIVRAQSHWGRRSPPRVSWSIKEIEIDQIRGNTSQAQKTKTVHQGLGLWPALTTPQIFQVFRQQLLFCLDEHAHLSSELLKPLSAFNNKRFDVFNTNCNHLALPGKTTSTVR